MTSRFAAILLCLSIVSTVAPLAASAAEDEPARYPVRLLSESPVLGTDLGIHGSQVAWATPAEDAVEIRLANVSSGEETVVAEIADPEGELRVPSVSFDGEWVAWADDRFGAWSVFATNVENASMVRLSEAGSHVNHIDTSGGFATWVRDRNLTLANLASEKTDAYREKTAQTPPSIDGPHVLWGRTEGTNTSVYVDNLDEGTVESLTVAENGTVSTTALTGNRAAWVASHYELEGREVKKVNNFTVETSALDDDGSWSKPVILDSIARVGPVATSGDWVAWKLDFEGRASPLRMVHVPTGGVVPFETLATGGPVMSEDHLAFVGADNATANRTGGFLYAVDLRPPPAETSTAQAPALGIVSTLGLTTVIAGVGNRRRRR